MKSFTKLICFLLVIFMVSCGEEEKAAVATTNIQCTFNASAFNAELDMPMKLIGYDYPESQVTSEKSACETEMSGVFTTSVDKSCAGSVCMATVEGVKSCVCLPEDVDDVVITSMCAEFSGTVKASCD